MLHDIGLMIGDPARGPSRMPLESTLRARLIKARAIAVTAVLRVIHIDALRALPHLREAPGARC